MAPDKSAFGGVASMPSLAKMEWRIGRRTAAFRLLTVLAFLFGYSLGGASGRGVGLAAYTTAEAGWQYLGFVAILWMALTAVRESVQRTSVLVFSKPQPVEMLALAKFVGGLLQVWTFLLALFVGSVCGRVFSGGLLGWWVYVVQYVRIAGVLFFASSASYTLALLFDNVIAGSLVGLYWVLTLAGRMFLGKFYFPAYTQNLPAYIFLGLAILLLGLLFYGRTRRGDMPAASWIRAGAPLCLLLSGWLFWTVIRDGHDMQARTNPILDRIQEQDFEGGHRIPGFLLPDQAGKLVKLSDYPGRILVVALWSPQDPDSALLLDRLDAIQSRLGAQGVQAIAICISQDNGAAATFAYGENLRYPVVTDWGTGNGPDRTEVSPLSSAYRANPMPVVVVTDRRRRARAALNGTQAYDGAFLDQILQERLADGPGLE